MTAVLISAVILLLFSVFFSVKRGIIDGYNNVLIVVTEAFSEYCESTDMGRILLDSYAEADGACAVSYTHLDVYKRQEARNTKGMPTAIIAHTVKGKGVSFMENQVGWHGKAPNDEEYAVAMEDLRKEGEALCQK